MAQTPQELKLLNERVKTFAYATKVEQIDTNSCKIWLSSGDNIVLCKGKEKSKTVKAIDIKQDVIIAVPHKGKAIKISRKPDQEGALLALYKATKGKAWKRNSGWSNTKQSISNWGGITCNGNGEVTHIKLTENNLQGKLPDVFYAFPRLQQLYLDKNQLTGQLPRSLAWLPKKCVVKVQRNKLETTTFYVPRQRISIVAESIRCYPQQDNDSSFRLFVDCDVDLNPTKGYYADNECILHHKANEGKGIDVYIVADGFDKAHYAIGGTAEYWLERAADAIFDIKPYSQLKNLFNVYIIYTYSKERGISFYGHQKDTRFGYWLKKPKDKSNTFKKQDVYDICKESSTKAGFRFANDKILHSIMIVNCTNVGGVEFRRVVKDGEEKRYLRTAIVPTYNSWFNSLIWHEFGGHVFGSLHDEYNKGGKLTKTYKKSSTRVNVDTESDPKKVKWARFIADPRYANEKLGVFQGALGYKNLYRPTQTSVMRSSHPDKRYNAPSRAGIYKRAMEMAFPDWKFDYETFVKFDLGDKYYSLEK